MRKTPTQFNIISLFPEAFTSYFDISLMKRAVAKGFIKVVLVGLRRFGLGARQTVDDRPYGGGAGMLLRVDVIHKALKKLRLKRGQKGKTIALLTPQGKPFDQAMALKLSKSKTITLICGRYEGFDERVRDLVDIEISLGDFVMTGGEIPALAVVDCVSRLVPGVVGKEESVEKESFAEPLLEYPQYTRPEKYLGQRVPKVLLSGDHRKVDEWRHSQAVRRTKKRRPDLLKHAKI
ncbi:MAG: tRNA (guanosine(37)-N1)-methyltransferase TrmD [Candidatus Saccharibacteria bacterium]